MRPTDARAERTSGTGQAMAGSMTGDVGVGGPDDGRVPWAEGALSLEDVLRLVDVRDEPLSVDEVLAAVDDPATGGTCVFVGTVRDVDHEREVKALSYSAHPKAEQRLHDVAAEGAAPHPVRALAAGHRGGDPAGGGPRGGAPG